MKGIDRLDGKRERKRTNSFFFLISAQKFSLPRRSGNNTNKKCFSISIFSGIEGNRENIYAMVK